MEATILNLIADLYAQCAQLKAENQHLRQNIAEIYTEREAAADAPDGEG